jgi:hypothetical protein
MYLLMVGQNLINRNLTQRSLFFTFLQISFFHIYSVKKIRPLLIYIKHADDIFCENENALI